MGPELFGNVCGIREVEVFSGLVVVECNVAGRLRLKHSGMFLSADAECSGERSGHRSCRGVNGRSECERGTQAETAVWQPCVELEAQESSLRHITS